jgi:acyl-CoA synthetase (AMP-forming)/AMP-acid ligase II
MLGMDGQPGRIKIKSDSLVDGYANDPEATARVFKDGWFYSGDMGTLVGPRRLKFLGRLDDILNIGGIKILPTTLEDLVVGTRLVAEAGVTSIPGPDGIHEICIAVVPEASVDLAAITREITGKIWPAALGRAHVMAMSMLPRTETGKLQRHRLRATFQEQAGRR